MLVQSSKKGGTHSRNKYRLDTVLDILMLSQKFEDRAIGARTSGYLKMKAEQTMVSIEAQKG